VKRPPKNRQCDRQQKNADTGDYPAVIQTGWPAFGFGCGGISHFQHSVHVHVHVKSDFAAGLSPVPGAFAIQNHEERRAPPSWRRFLGNFAIHVMRWWMLDLCGQSPAGAAIW
jgi:hypothetical protein